ncbi:MAG TPA: DUF3786 domain-containing protein, partial [Dissulfurispiraceae bacterium]
KKLPGKNCGDCPQKTCMPFALALLRGEAGAGECPHMPGEKKEELERSLTKSDWREELILKLGEEIRNVDFREIAEGIGAVLQDGMLSLKCMGRDFTVSPGGEIAGGAHVTPWMKILLLHYIRTSGAGGAIGLSGKWVSYRELRNGMVKYSSFRRECEEPLREMLDKDTAGAKEFLRRAGAEPREDFPTKDAWHFFLLPRVPVIILYWPPDEEFPSKAQVLFDSTADRYLDVESLIFLVEGFVKNMERAIYP